MKLVIDDARDFIRIADMLELTNDFSLMALEYMFEEFLDDEELSLTEINDLRYYYHEYGDKYDNLTLVDFLNDYVPAEYNISGNIYELDAVSLTEFLAELPINVPYWVLKNGNILVAE